MAWLEHVVFRETAPENYIIYFFHHTIGQCWKDKMNGQWYALARPQCLDCKKVFSLGRGFNTHEEVAEALKLCPACGETPCMDLPEPTEEG